MKTLTGVMISAAVSAVLMNYCFGTSLLYPVVVHLMFYLFFMLFMTICQAVGMRIASPGSVEAYDKRVSWYSRPENAPSSTGEEEIRDSE